MSATPDSTFADPQELIADLKRQLAEREAERDAALAREREALDQQTATAEVLGVINASPGNLLPVFDAILEKAMRLCEAAFGMLHTFDGKAGRLVAKHGLPPRFAEFAENPSSQPGPGGATPRLIAGARVVHIVDLKDEEAYRSGEPYRLALVELGGARTLLAVPLRKDGNFLGQITVYRQKARPYSEKQISLLESFAAQAVMAMENARLITETREALEQQTATAEVLRVINASPGDLGPVFDAMLENATRLCEATHGHVWSFDGHQLHAVAVRGDAPFVEWLQQHSPVRPIRGSAAERIARGELLVHLADRREEDAYRNDATFRALVDTSGIRASLSVALRRDEKLLGMINVYRQEVRPFTDKQIALLQNFAAQAVIAMENARLLTETREALEQQTATAEVLGVINASPGDLQPVFDAVVDRAAELCEADEACVRTFDGSVLNLVAVHGPPGIFEELMRLGPSYPDGFYEDIAQKGASVTHFVDVRETEILRVNARARERIELRGIRSWLAVALRKEDALLGVINVHRREVRPFTDKQIVLLENFAAQAVIAMENARLLGELRQRTDDLTESLEYQTAISDVLKVISQSAFDLEPVLQTVVETAMRLCGNDSASIFRLSDGGYRLAVHYGLTPEEYETESGYTHQPGADSLVGRAALERRPIHIFDAWDDPLYELKDQAKAANWRTLLGVPLLCEREPVGVICLGRKRVEPFTREQIDLISTFADQAVIAIENARLLGELRERTDEVAELNRGLEARVAEQVDELGRVGRLKRFLAPQLAELIVSQGDEKILESHRREIVVVFCDLRGYTAFTETAEPEEVLGFLREYHGALGPLVSQYEGTLDQFSGDGIMVFFNDPVPIPDPAERAVKMAMAMREAAGDLIAAWRRDGCELGFGAGIAQGYATLGQIGFSERSGYTAIGTVCNLASRLCAEAKDGQILVSGRVARAVEAVTTLENLGELELRGLRRPVAAFNVAHSSAADGRPNLTVVASEPGSRSEQS